jgi:hypothetical protein
LERQVEDGFPFLPSGCQIILDPVAREVVLTSIRQQISPRWAALRDELRRFEGDRLASFLQESGRSLADLVRSDGRSWMALCRDAGKAVPPAGPREGTLGRRVRALARVDDALRWEAYVKLLAGGGLAGGGSSPAARSPAERRLASMLFFSLFPDGGSFPDVDAGFAGLAAEPALCDELTQVVDLGFDHARRSTSVLADLAPQLADVPLAVHASYTREEILAALDHASMQRRPSSMREGVAWCDSVQSDAFLITLKKSERDYSPTTMYRDYALGPDLFHWESQSTTSMSSPTGQRYISHGERGTHILLFVRAVSKDALGTVPYVFLGPADYVSHTGDRPMAITWRLRREMPTEVYLSARAAVS